MELCCDYVDEWVMVNEEEIARAVYFMVKHHHKVSKFAWIILQCIMVQIYLAEICTYFVDILSIN